MTSTMGFFRWKVLKLNMFFGFNSKCIMAFNKYCCNVLALTMHGNNSLPITYKNPPYDPFICQLPLPPPSPLYDPFY